MDVRSYIREQGLRVEQALELYLPKPAELPQSLHKSMRYSIFAGGKRIRPVLMLAACDAVGGDSSLALPAACAMEMIHTYSLIHDDLPAMDDDDYRRGNPTNHKVFGEATAILAGDALLTEAFILLSCTKSFPGIPYERLIKVMHEISCCAGSRGMVGGQVVDMESEGLAEIDLATVQYIHTHKTGALIKASVKTGAIIGGASDAGLAAINKYGEALGLAFQIADDILDIEGTTEEIGKDAGSDQARGKATYPSVIGLTASKNRASELVALAIESLSDYDEKADPLRNLANYIIERRS